MRIYLLWCTDFRRQACLFWQPIQLHFLLYHLNDTCTIWNWKDFPFRISITMLSLFLNIPEFLLQCTDPHFHFSHQWQYFSFWFYAIALIIVNQFLLMKNPPGFISNYLCQMNKLGLLSFESLCCDGVPLLYSERFLSFESFSCSNYWCIKLHYFHCRT